MAGSSPSNEQANYRWPPAARCALAGSSPLNEQADCHFGASYPGVGQGGSSLPSCRARPHPPHGCVV
eukprot:259281-Heterocapsa_arctica.AAC.1